MTEQQFCYWLQGFCELNNTPPTPEQWKSIKEHLTTVFNKITPQYVPGIPYVPPLDMRIPATCAVKK